MLKKTAVLITLVFLWAACLAGCKSAGKKALNASTQSNRTAGAVPSIWIVMDSLSAGMGPAHFDQSLAGVAIPSYKIVERIKCGSNPRNPAVGDGSVWVSNFGDDTLTRIDPSAGKAIATIKIPAGAVGFALGDGSAWVADGSQGVTRVDLSSDKPVAQIPTDIGPRRVAATKDAVWVTHVSFSVVRIDPATDRKVAAIATKIEGIPVIPLDIAATKSAVWVITDKGAILRIDPASNRVVATIKGLARVSGVSVAMGGITRIVAGEGAVWAVNQNRDAVARINPSTNSIVATIKLGAPILDLATGHGAVWVLHGQDGSLARIDPASNHATDVGHFGKASRAIAVASAAAH